MVTGTVRMRRLLCGAVIFFILPAVGYFGFAYFAAYYAGDALHTTAAQFFRSAAIAVDALFPYLCTGMMCGAVALYGFSGNGVIFWCGLGAKLLPYLFEIVKNCLVTPSLQNNTDYLTAAASYTTVNFLLDAAIYCALALVSFLFYKKGGSAALLRSLAVCTAVFVLIRLGFNVADTVDYVNEQLHEYYNEISAGEVITIVLSYVKILLFGAAGFLLSLLQNVFCRKAPSPKPGRRA